MRLSRAKFSAAFPTRFMLTSSLRPTSSTQCSCSLAQCTRITSTRLRNPSQFHDPQTALIPFQCQYIVCFLLDYFLRDILLASHGIYGSSTAFDDNHTAGQFQILPEKVQLGRISYAQP